MSAFPPLYVLEARTVRLALTRLHLQGNSPLTMQPTPEQRAQLEAEHGQLAAAARERKSVDRFARAGLEGFIWGILGGVLGKLFWDSVRPPLFFYPLVLLDALLLWDAVRHYRAARTALVRESLIESRLREVRVHLGIDPKPQAAAPLFHQETRT